MTLHVDPRAIVHPTAKLADGVTIGPFAIIGEEVTIGAETSIAAHAVLERWTVIGARCRIGTGAVLGGAPQHLKYDGSPSYLHIGDENDIRELVVIQRSMLYRPARYRGSSKDDGGCDSAGDLRRALEKGLPQLGCIPYAAAFQSCCGRLWRTNLRANDCFANRLPGQATRG